MKAEYIASGPQPALKRAATVLSSRSTGIAGVWIHALIFFAIGGILVGGLTESGVFVAALGGIVLVAALLGTLRIWLTSL